MRCVRVDAHSAVCDHPRVRLPGWFVGPALTGTVLLAFVGLDATVVRIQNPAPIFLIAVTFAGYVGGLRPALLSAAFAIAFSLYYFAVPGQPLTYLPAEQARVTSLVVGTTAIAVLTGLLRERLVRAERATARERVTRAAQAAAAHERDRLRLILDQLPEAVTISDESGTFILRNRAAETLFPWPDRRVETVIANAEYLRPDGTPYHPEDLPGARARRGEVVQAEELIVRVREPFREVPILMNAALLRAPDGTPLGTVSVFQDISARKRIDAERATEQQQLRDSETKLRATVEVALDALVAMDTAGRITDWNPSAEAIFGHPRAAVIGREMASVIIPERYRESHRAGLRHYLETGQGRVIGRRIEIEALHAQGHEIPVELAISAVRTSEGQSFTAFLRDISARRRLEAAQAAALAEVRQALRLRDEFLAAAAHDLKTPLTAISGHLQLVRRRVDAGLAPRVATSLDEAERSTSWMNALIDELLDVARLQSGEALVLDRREIDLVDVARSVVDRATQRAQRHALELEPSVTTLIGPWDPARIERVLTNLVDNAIKYSPRGGTIRVALDREADGAQAWAVVAIRDEGLGIPAADLPRLFTRFYRASNTGGIAGTGIGLEAAQRMVEQHGGSIGVESIEGRGTTVTVRLPLEPTQ